LNKFAYYNGFVVGAVCTRIEPVKEGQLTGAGMPTTSTDTMENAENVTPSPPTTPTTSPTKLVESTTTTVTTPGGKQRLYIMTLAVLAAYRGRGIGAQLIQSVLDHCDTLNKEAALHDNTTLADNNNSSPEKNASSPTKHAQVSNNHQRVDEIALHVQISNEDAIRFYTSKFGFEKGEMVENYYRRIDPPHCYILSKKLL